MNSSQILRELLVFLNFIKLWFDFSQIQAEFLSRGRIWKPKIAEVFVIYFSGARD
jgi:hypothetical protein